MKETNTSTIANVLNWRKCHVFNVVECLKSSSGNNRCHFGSLSTAFFQLTFLFLKKKSQLVCCHYVNLNLYVHFFP